MANFSEIDDTVFRIKTVSIYSHDKKSYQMFLVSLSPLAENIKRRKRLKNEYKASLYPSYKSAVVY
jgi:tetrahydromethanopterin S-methyltransferase subunit B